MNPRYTEALYCPICDVPSRECLQPDSETVNGAIAMYTVAGHSGHWITLAERARDEALENLRTNRSTLSTLALSEEQPQV